MKTYEIMFYDDWNMIYKVICPHCSMCLDLGHLKWSALLCEFCDKQINNLNQITE